MPSAATLRLEIERKLDQRFPVALTPAPRTIHGVYETGIGAVDHLLGGGLPVGAISELTGPESSGRTSLALAFVTQRTAEGRACAWVDVDDTLDPESAAANGVLLGQLLWVRCGDKGAGAASGLTKKSEPPTKHPSGAKAPTHFARLTARVNSCPDTSCLFREVFKKAATSHPSKTQLSSQISRGVRGHGARMWARLEQGLRATDLLLQAGGFAAIVLDLGDTAPEQACRIPLATWFRYRQAAERTQCSLVVIGKRAYAQSAAGVVLECEAAHADAAGENAASGTVLRGFAYSLRRGRERFAPVEIGTRKPPLATWQADAMWDAERDPKRARA